MIFSTFHLLPLLLAPLIVNARPAEPNQSTSRDARQLLAPVHYMPMVQPGFGPNYRYGYNPLVTRPEDSLEDLESRIGLALLLLLANGFDDRVTSNSGVNRPFLNWPLGTPLGTRPLRQRPVAIRPQ